MKKDEKEIRFPKDFLFGVSTAAYQNEGDNFNSNWYEWEKQGKIEKKQKCGDACNDYRDWENGKNIKILKDLGVQSYRFSLEWSRIEPKEGRFDKEEIGHYRRILLELRKNNIEPFVTLFHYSLPIWFADKGGFEKEENIKYFERFVEKVVKEYKRYVKFWITINEPEVYSLYGYLLGFHPPGIESLFKTSKVYGNLVLTHIRIYDLIKSRDNKANVGLAKNQEVLQPRKNNIFTKIFAKLINYLYNEIYLSSLLDGRLYYPLSFNRRIGKKKLDFIGLNYYFRVRFEFSLKKDPNSLMKFIKLYVPKSRKNKDDFNVEMYPEGIYKKIKKLSKWRIPIYITENGISTKDENKRITYIEEHLKQVKKAIDNGEDVRGYSYWTLFDNFEWAYGYTPRFGLMTRDKKAKKSYHFYQKICRGKELLK